MENLLKNLEKINYAELDIDDILDGRDSEPFDSEWMRDQLLSATSENCIK